MNYGFVKVGAAVPELKVADCEFNSGKIVEFINKADKEDCQIILFPELSITAYTCGDLFHQEILLEQSMTYLNSILENTRDTDIVAILGMPVKVDAQLFNSGVVIQSGEILGVVPKTYIPGYKEFYEERWFASGVKALSDSVNLCGKSVPFGIDLLFDAANFNGACFGIEICEDLWVPVPPSSYQAMLGATMLFNLSASNEIIGKSEYRRELIKQQSAKCIAGYVYASSGIYESTTDVVFGGHALIAENGGVLSESERFSMEGQLLCCEIDVAKLNNDRMKNTSFMEADVKNKARKIGFNIKKTKLNDLCRFVDPHPFVPSDPGSLDKRCKEIFAIQTAGLAKRLLHTGMKNAVIGISGGLDSTLALLVTWKTFDMLGIPTENIHAITMPGFGTTDETYYNALNLMKSLNVTISEVDIKPACIQHFKDIGHDMAIHDVTYENVQARERTQILMDISNKIGGVVIGTGDLSELALGWCTYNGDHMSMYSVNCSIPKTLVKFLVGWVADNMSQQNTRTVLKKILSTPISPELLPPDEKGKINQKTEDIIGPYELHDFFLYHMIRYGASPDKILFLCRKAFNGRYEDEVIVKWLKTFLKRFFTQQFKRSCLPDGPKVGTISLSPRGDWRMPSDAEANLWLKNISC
ncbi:NAD(+) synthase [Pseudobacteroides cellulosolvens]|uniref:Glutamine-dependent NAD(+) synthetase n=1 Tax=Pseudobacteroides cellulosolvens ATCC 35603 = DSM 2933 TaxID=398512 RepID=A0A0L6JMP0_9FIRM|nr:NAD(+) synthase [Pseudobacteroides cellulosolvens]KNY27030.1 NAD+ synthetase [Pseudobacteroides cellulosolvens ATCC 35603 = DSM 2933]